MADNDQNNDEYKFEELDSLDNNSMENTEYGSDSPASSGQMGAAPEKNIKRNALIVVGVVVFVMLMYKFIGGMLSEKSTPKESITPAPITEVTPPQPTPTEMQPEPIKPQPVVQQAPVVNPELQQKVESIEASQESVKSEVSSVSQQVGNVNNNVTSLSAQVNTLNQMISNLTSQVTKQSEEINVLMERIKPKPVKRIIRPRVISQPTIYYINAVIPGRAWLIGTNGSTLTVREGTKIAGYGIVKLIDSIEGRVLTSSGRVIRFSQKDS